MERGLHHSGSATVERVTVLPDEFYARAARPGYTLLTGRQPVAGERVWLTRLASCHVFADTWFFVERTRPAYSPDNVWLSGVDLHRDERRAVLVVLARVVVERAVAPR